MTRIRGFKLGRRLIRISRWILKKTRNRKGYHRLGSPDSAAMKSMAMAKILTWGRKLTRGARSLCAVKPGSGYSPMGSDPEKEERRAVPKGKLAVYVGQKEQGEFQRVLVPVIYFNHPLFGELLREAEEEYGFNHPGGITIPCRFTEFERVKTRIASGSGGGSGRRLAWRWHY